MIEQQAHLPQGEKGSGAFLDMKFTESGGAGWWIASGTDNEYYYEADAAQSDYDLPDNGETSLQAIVDIDSTETVKFYWRVSSQQSHDYLQFYIDNTLKDQISGEVGWQQKSYPVNSGIHILKWRYVKDGSGYSGDDCGWVDFVQWTGPSPTQDPSNWQEIAYKDDVAGQRIEKKVDGYSTRYVHDGDQVIAEYDGNNNLLRKYIYGPGIDQPVCMTEVADSNAVYYYHFDALGSVVALSDGSGDTVQTYEYSVYGEVAVEDANHTNPYMFAGVRYDIEIGLYYNRARYYNPYMGRFLQADPVGYDAGMNLYAYCVNNPLSRTDPSGLETFPEPEFGKGEKQGDYYYNATGRVLVLPGAWFPPDLTDLEEGWNNVENMSELGNWVTVVNLYGSYVTGDTAAFAANLTQALYDNTAARAALERIKKLIGDIAMTSIGHYAYSPFIEVAIENKAASGEHGTRWVGVRKIANSGLLQEVMGDHVYDTYEEAFIAGVTGACNYNNWLNGTGDSDIYYGWSEYTGDAMTDESGTHIDL